MDKKGKNGIIVFAAAVTVVGVLAILLLTEKGHIVSVAETIGEAIVNRPEISDDLAVFVGLRIEKEDVVSTGAKSEVTFQIDDDKIVRLIENSVASFKELTGSEKNQHTLIYLKEGTLVNDIRERLSGDSTYQITTPNATVSVRGTFFTVRVGWEDGFDGIVTIINVYHGSVEVESTDGKIYILTADGVKETSMLVLEGNHAIVGNMGMDIIPGLDFFGLNEADLDRLEELALAGEISMTIEEIEKQRELLRDREALKGVEEDGLEELEVIIETRTKEEEIPGEDDKKKNTPENNTGSVKPGNKGDQAGTKQKTDGGDGNSGIVSGGWDDGNDSGDWDDGSDSGGWDDGNDNEGGTGGTDSGDENSGNGTEGGTGGTEGGGDSNNGNDDIVQKPTPEELEKYLPKEVVIRNLDDINARITKLETNVERLNRSATYLTAGQKATLAGTEQNIQDTKQKITDVDEVNRFLNAVNDLPYPSQIKAENKAAVEMAEDTYHALTTEQKKFVPKETLDKLDACLKKAQSD